MVSVKNEDKLQRIPMPRLRIGRSQQLAASPTQTFPANFTKCIGRRHSTACTCDVLPFSLFRDLCACLPEYPLLCWRNSAKVENNAVKKQSGGKAILNIVEWPKCCRTSVCGATDCRLNLHKGTALHPPKSPFRTAS